MVEIGEGLVFDDGDYQVRAYPLNHPVECYGYRVEEHDKPGALNAAALQADGVKRPAVPASEARRDRHAGRRARHQRSGLPRAAAAAKLAILGIPPLPFGAQACRGVDVMVHEATLEAAMEEKPTAGAQLNASGGAAGA